jgi:hypothetical protein
MNVFCANQQTDHTVHSKLKDLNSHQEEEEEDISIIPLLAV